jgi:quinoprotein glucose dehydrogenase
MLKKIAIVGTFGSLVGAVALAQNAAIAGRNWPSTNGDQGGSRYSSLNQINVSNVSRLTRAWTFKTGSGRFASAPMVIDSVMYFSAPNGVYAVDAVTGTQIWKYAPPADLAAAAGAGGAGAGGRGGGRGAAPAAGAAENPDAPAGAGGAGAGGAGAGGRAGGGGRGGGRGGGGESAGTATRGPAYWAGGSGIAPRIYSTTLAGLAAIDAKSGTLVASFGQNGVIPTIRPDSPAVIYRNVLITQGDVEPGRGNTVKGWDVVTGKHVWTFYLKAQADDPNRKSWITGWEESSGPGLWGYFTLDEERGTLFVPVEKVGNDYWGGPHHGNNLYSDSLVALDALTGKMKWYQQLVHHDIWDYDLSAPPALVEVRRNGQVIPAVVQQTKMALLFIFHRETGEPIFGMEERPVPQTTVPGEWTSPTQPFPVKPAPLARNSIKRSELSKVTPEHQAFCEGLWDKYKLQDSVPYQPWQTGQDIVVYPGAQGGGNWYGVSFNRPLGLIYANVMTAGQWGQLVAGGGRRGAPAAPAAAPAGAAGQGPATGTGRAGAPMPMGKRTPEGGRFWNPQKQWDCSDSPWGELVAVNANTGDIAWRVPLGENEELAAKGIINGTPQAGGSITTAGNLIFIGSTTDETFRAFDARNGKILWSDKIPASAHTTPTTYQGRNGKQYVVVGANGGSFFGSPTSDEVIAYALP